MIAYLHELLIQKMRRKTKSNQFLGIVISAIKTPIGKKNINENKNSVGVPQGLSISNHLAEIYFSDIDKRFQNNLIYFRFVDDILIICPRSKARAIYRRVSRALEKNGLSCHELSGDGGGKSGIRTLGEGVDYLGYKIVGAPKVSASVRLKSYQKMMSNIVRVFTDYKYRNRIDLLVWRLNLRISGCVIENKRIGWMFFFSQTDDVAQLARLDLFVVSCLKKYGCAVNSSRIKRFVKSYHEIRYKFDRTKYIINFDKFEEDQIVDFLVLMTGQNEAVFRSMPRESLESRFWRLVYRETSDLERDLIEATS
jgi:RNA-directed DNA polymerase